MYVDNNIFYSTLLCVFNIENLTAIPKRGGILTGKMFFSMLISYKSDLKKDYVILYFESRESRSLCE